MKSSLHGFRQMGLKFLVLLFMAMAPSPAEAVENAAADRIMLWPPPKQIDIEDANVSLADLKVVDHANAANTTSLLIERLQEQYGLEFADSKKTGELIVGRIGSDAIADTIRQWEIKHSLRDEHQDGFLLAIRQQGILLAAPNDRGLYYAVRALLQVIDYSTPVGEAPQARCMTITDWPDQRMRGLFWRLDTQRGGRYEIDDLKEYIDRVVAGARYNTIVLMMRRGLLYKSHPHVANRFAFTRDEFKELVAFCRRHYIDVIPATNTPGHADWMLRTRTMHLAELNGHTICTRNPQALKMIFDINQELIELCGGKDRVKFFHVGHDEVRWLKVHKSIPQIRDSCPLCKGTPYNELFLEYIRKEHKWFQDRGIRMMMWGDMLAAGHNGPKYNTHGITREMPKDIAIVPWSALDYPEIARWVGEGFDVVKGATGYKQLSISDDIVSGHMLCLFTPSPWLVFSTTATSSHNYYNHVSVLMFARNAWNNDPSYHATNARERTNLKTTVQKRAEKKKLEFIARSGNALNFRFNNQRFPAETAEFKVIDLSLHANRRLQNCFEAGDEFDLSGLKPRQVELAGIPTRLPGNIIVPNGDSKTSSAIRIDNRAASFVFLHTAYLPQDQVKAYRKRIAGSEPETNMTSRNNPIGFYRVRYQDGSEQQVSINFGLNVSHLRPPIHSRFPYDVRYVYRAADHGSKWPEAVDCRDLTPGAPALYQYEWKNPDPKQLVDSIELVSLETEVVPALVALTLRLTKVEGKR